MAKAAASTKAAIRVPFSLILVEALWEWSPAVVAGLLPLVGFLLPMAMVPQVHPAHLPVRLDSHLLVLSIVTSSVSVITSFARVLTGRIPNIILEGRGPILLVMLLLGLTVYSTGVYALVEAGFRNEYLDWMAGGGVAATLVISLYMEVTMTRLRLLDVFRKRRAASRKTLSEPTPDPASSAKGEPE